MKITFLGTGTSDGVPLVACSCSTCSSSYVRNNRLRSSILIESSDTCVLIDVSSDFRVQALRNNIKRLDAIFLTHADADHTSGIPDLRALNWSSGGTLPFYAEKHLDGSGRWGIDAVYHQYRYAFNNEMGKKGRPSLLYHNIKSYNSYHIKELVIEPLSVWHGDMPILAFKINRFAYITDASKIPQSTMNHLIQQVDVLVINAVRRYTHTRHFSLEQAVSVAQIIQARQTYFTHISHDMEHKLISKVLPSNMYLAYDGLSILI